jgi:phage terminase large subunit-like protein
MEIDYNELAKLSNAQKLCSLTPVRRQAIIESLSDQDLIDLKYSFEFWSRPSQRPPLWAWSNWLIMAGRGYGKTYVGANITRMWAESGKVERIRLIGADAGDCRDVMVEGPSGIMAMSRPDFMPVYEPSKKRITWPNGCKANLFSAEDPDELRGPEHEKAWADEPIKWQYPLETWDQHSFGLRIGTPQSIITTTPRPIKLIKDFILDENKATAITRGSTYENRANLANSFFTSIIKKYEGTHLGQQELLGLMISEVPGALWNRQIIEDSRVKESDEMIKVVVAVDPAATSRKTSNKTGIIGCGLGEDRHGYILKDKSIVGKPIVWGKAVCDLFHELQADIVIAEGNQGGEMVQTVINGIDANIPVKLVWASRGKHVRAEPISLKYQQGKVHHVGYFPALEDQMCQHTPETRESPDEMDAMVHGMTNLFHRGSFII